MNVTKDTYARISGRSVRTQRAMNFLETEFVCLVEQYGAIVACDHEWTLCTIVNLFNAGGTEDDVREVIGRVGFQLAERAVPPAVVAHVNRCLGRRIEDAKTNMARAFKEGARPRIRDQFSHPRS